MLTSPDIVEWPTKKDRGEDSSRDGEGPKGKAAAVVEHRRAWLCGVTERESRWPLEVGGTEAKPFVPIGLDVIPWAAGKSGLVDPLMVRERYMVSLSETGPINNKNPALSDPE